MHTQPQGATPASSCGKPQGLSKSRRLRKSALFQEAYAQGDRWFGPSIVLWLRSGPDADLRLGVVASKKVGPAVVRARAKRRLREVYRRHRQHLEGPHDVILIARRAIRETDWEDLVNEFLRLADDAGLKRKQEQP